MTIEQVVATKRELLTPGELRALCDAIGEGKKANEELEAAGEKTAARKRFLRNKLAEGDAARIEVIDRNLGLVKMLANRHYSVVHGRADVEDVIQNGVFGLSRAAELFDPGRGYKFSTYAWFWIRKAMDAGARDDCGDPVFSSETARERRFRINAIEELLADNLGRNPTDDELAVECHLDVEEVKLVRHSTVAYLDEAALKQAHDGQWNALTVDDERSHLSFEVGEIINGALDRLDKGLRDAVMLRFGFDGAEQRSYASVGEMLGITEWEARGRIEQALTRLRLDPEVGDAD